MKLTIDTEEKTIQVYENINLKELLEFVRDHFKKDWHEYTINSCYYYPYPYTPVSEPWWIPEPTTISCTNNFIDEN